MTTTHRVLIIGGGFGGLNAARNLRKVPAHVTLVDRCNYHLFQPLLYQVATGGLSPANIAAPLRGILRYQPNTNVFWGEVIEFDPENQRVRLEDSELSYDTLIVAVGATHSYFGNNHWASVAPGIKTVEDATSVRAKVLSAFERAERESDPTLREKLLTFVIVGAGPTGVELAGALSELSRHTLKQDFRHIQPADARIIVVDAAPRVLTAYPEKLSTKAREFLKQLEVEVLTDMLVTNVEPGRVTLQANDRQTTMEAETILWAAGVQASPLGEKLGAATGAQVDKVGRIHVQPNLSLPGHPEIFAIGDMAHCKGADGEPLPGVAQVAIQQGKYVAKLITRRLRGKTSPSFHYRDLGKLATIGRSLAIAELKGYQFAGFFAWLLWLFVHLMQLVQFQNRVLVLMQWTWNYLTHNRSARLITWKEAGLHNKPPLGQNECREDDP